MNIFSTDKERRIISLFQRGDASAMSMLYSEYSAWLTAVAARYVPDNEDLKDVLQEGFIKIFTQISSFEYRGKGSLKAWTSRIITNEALHFLRGKSGEIVNTVENLPDYPDEDPDIDNLSAEELQQIIKRLPQGYRAVFNLYAVEGKSHKQIAEMLGIKPDTSASQFHKAKNMLANMINEYKKQKQ